MPETTPPYGLLEPVGSTDDPADWPSLVGQNNQNLSTKIIGQFATSQDAQAALGSSSQTPMFYTTSNPTTLWCLDSSGPQEVWTLGGGYTSGTFQMWDQDGQQISLGSSQRSLYYRVQGARVYGWAYMALGQGFSPTANKYLWFSLPFAPVIHQTGEQQALGNAIVKMSGGTRQVYTGIVTAASQSAHCVIIINDPNQSRPGAAPINYGTGGSSGKTWSTGDSIQYSFDYERAV